MILGSPTVCRLSLCVTVPCAHRSSTMSSCTEPMVFILATKEQSCCRSTFIYQVLIDDCRAGSATDACRILEGGIGYARQRALATVSRPRPIGTREDTEAFEALPSVVRSMGPWAGGRDGEVDRPRLSYCSIWRAMGCRARRSQHEPMRQIGPRAPYPRGELALPCRSMLELIYSTQCRPPS